MATQAIISEMVIKPQTRVYIGPVEDHISGEDLTEHFGQYGPIVHVSRLGGRTQFVSSTRTSYGVIDFKQTISMRRAFGAKIFIQGKHVKVALSRLAMEVLLSPCVVFFYEAHEMIGDGNLDRYFGQFGQIYRCCQMIDDENRNKTYGFVDYINPESASAAANQKSPLMPPGQYIKVSKFLPQKFLYDMFAVGDKRGEELIAEIGRLTPKDGSWQAGRRGPKDWENPRKSHPKRVYHTKIVRTINYSPFQTKSLRARFAFHLKCSGS
jgi:RNA recognition motif-containing protein